MKLQTLPGVAFVLLGGCYWGGCSSGAPTFNQQMQAVLTPYLSIQEALAADSLEGIAAASKELILAADSLERVPVPAEHAEQLGELPKTVRASALGLQTAENLPSAREHFRAVSRVVSVWANGARPSNIEGVWCSMTRGGWVQRAGPIRNPYHGSEMLECGEKVF